MKHIPLRYFSLFSMGLVLSMADARADDAANPPAPPPAPASPQTSPGGGTPPARHRHMRPGFILEDLTAKLGLTADQQKTVGAIIANSRSQAKALRGDDSISREDRRQKMQEILGTARTQIRAALTPAQQALFDALPANGGGPPPPPPPNT
ncbi:MAG: hypothetical protein ABSF76_06380 [Opitutaceae bacterium]|jgi:hypothetical protein